MWVSITQFMGHEFMGSFFLCVGEVLKEQFSLNPYEFNVKVQLNITVSKLGIVEQAVVGESRQQFQISSKKH